MLHTSATWNDASGALQRFDGYTCMVEMGSKVEPLVAAGSPPGWPEPSSAGSAGQRARSRPMTIRWIWLVPSKICITFASRMYRSTGKSRV